MIFLLEERHPLTLAFTVSLVTQCDVPWKPFFLPRPILRGLCLAWLCQIAAPSSHLVTSQTGAGWWQSWKYNQQTGGLRESDRGDGRLPRGVFFFFFFFLFPCLCLCARGAVPCLKLRGLLARYCPHFICSPLSLISHSAAATVTSTDGECLLCWTVSRANWLLFV